MNTSILKLNKAGSPQAWITFETAAIAKAKGLVLWEMGSITKTLHGGVQRTTGMQSFFDLPAIIAVDGNTAEMSSKLVTYQEITSCLCHTAVKIAGRTVSRVAVSVITSKMIEHQSKPEWSYWLFHLHLTCTSIFTWIIKTCCRIKWIF